VSSNHIVLSKFGGSKNIRLVEEPILESPAGFSVTGKTHIISGEQCSLFYKVSIAYRW